MRTIIEVATDQLTSLDRWCKLEGISRAEAIRRAIDEHLQRHRTTEDAAFGLWRDRDLDGLSYQQRARHEWDRARPSRRSRKR